MLPVWLLHVLQAAVRPPAACNVPVVGGCTALPTAGFTNDFLINTRHPNAIIYNDRSVNENFHVSCAFRLAQLPETNIFEGLSRQEFVQVRWPNPSIAGRCHVRAVIVS